MEKAAQITSFLESIMRISPRSLNGASAGILGSAGASADVIHNIKRASLAFAEAARKPAPSHDELLKHEQEIVGFAQTLQLMYVLSDSESNKLIKDLQSLTDSARN